MRSSRPVRSRRDHPARTDPAVLAEAAEPHGDRRAWLTARWIRDVQFAERDSGPLLMDVALPHGRGPFPAILWLHGGGWFTGDRTLAPELGRWFAARGFVMASAEYRLSDIATFPAQLFDVRSAVRFLRRRAGRFGVDPTAIGLWGSSAGGHLAALAAATGNVSELEGEATESGDASVQAVSEGYGPVDLAAVVAAAPADFPMAGRNAPESRLLGGLPAQRPALAARASPLGHLTRAAPPFQILHGTADVLVPHAQSELLHKALADAGGTSTLYSLDGFRHGFLNPAGRVDLDGPKAMDDGRLAAESAVPADYRCVRPGHPERTGRTRVSFDAIGDFFAEHLQGRGNA